MAIVDVHIFGKSYSIACDNGQEKHLKELAVYLDRKVKSIATSLSGSGMPNEGYLMVVTALMLADELNDSTMEIADLKNLVEDLQTRPSAAPAAQEAGGDAYAIYQKSIESIAERVEAIAEELEKAA